MQCVETVWEMHMHSHIYQVSLKRDGGWGLMRDDEGHENDHMTRKVSVPLSTQPDASCVTHADPNGCFSLVCLLTGKGSEDMRRNMKLSKSHFSLRK